MLNFKSCPRCNGDVNLERDWYGEYASCLQCGWSKDSTNDPLSESLRLKLDKLHEELPQLVRAS